MLAKGDCPMAKRLLVLTAAGVSLLTAGLHVFGGGPEFHEPALASALDPAWKAAFSTIWHQVTAFLLLNAMFLAATSLSPKLNRGMLMLIGAQNLSFGILFLFYGWMRLGSPFILMQWLIFFAIAALIAAAAWLREPLIRVEETPVDARSRSVLAGADFMDAHTRSLSHPKNALAVARDIFGRSPRWVHQLLALRNLIVAPFGLIRDPGAVLPTNECIGIFPILSQSPERAVLGLDDKHLDFRIVIELLPETVGRRVVLTTLVKTHNIFGRLYLAVVKPFHRIIVPAMLRNADGPDQSLDALSVRV
jgi:hypothetical protein